MNTKQFDGSDINEELIILFLKDAKLDNNLIHILRLYAAQNLQNFQYLSNNFANILSSGINSGIERENKSWNAIEIIIGLYSSTRISENDYFIGTWKAFSILIQDFANFNRHSIAVQKAYYRFEEYFVSVRHQLYAKDCWYTVITDYNWWLRVDEFYKSRFENKSPEDSELKR